MTDLDGRTMGLESKKNKSQKQCPDSRSRQSELPQDKEWAVEPVGVEIMTK